MSHIYICFELINDLHFFKRSNRRDTPAQSVSNAAYNQISNHLNKFGYDLDIYTSSTVILPDDYIIVVNVRTIYPGRLYYYYKLIKTYFLNLIRTGGAFFHAYSLRKITDKSQILIYLWEGHGVLPSNYLHNKVPGQIKFLTWDQDLVDMKMYYPLYLQVGPLSESIGSDHICRDKNNLLCSISNNKVSFTKHGTHLIKISTYIELLSVHGNKFSLYGYGWGLDRPIYVGEIKFPFVAYYKYIVYLFTYYNKYKSLIQSAQLGMVEDKMGTISQYKFTLCFENNTFQRGYITEKIFDCFVAGTVPIYCGNSQTIEMIPQGCYIDFNVFESTDHMVSYIQNVDNARDYINSIDGLIYQYKPKYQAKCIVDSIIGEK